MRYGSPEQILFNIESAFEASHVVRTIDNFVDDAYMGDYNYQQITDPFTFESVDFTVEA